MDYKVNEYLKKQKSPQKEICQKLREIILKIFPNILEEMKYGVPYYGDKYYIVALKTHVNLGFSIKDLTKDEIAFFEGSGKTTRHIKFNTLEEIEEEKIIKLLKMVKK
ncbi:MAG: DUF1801 domain-containing protein [Promethearchaeota archaeon]|nr:MAG: DUF1801 domain-containing protein [Candidatus Lokiarchaeota archaeon]